MLPESQASMLRLNLVLERAEFRLALALDLPGRGVSALYGPSGSGKTSLLRCIAGLEPAARGRLEVGGSCWQDDETRIRLPTHQRRLGYVFQEPSLFTHLDVEGNLVYGYTRVPAAERRYHPQDMIGLLGLAPLLRRPVKGLSGGERQRIALARALLSSPSLLLLDEPLAALDAASRHEILPFLERCFRTLALPVLYVSHQLEEVVRLADHLVLLDQGRPLASGPTGELLARLDLPLAQEEDAGVVIDMQVGEEDPLHHLTRLHFAGGSVLVAARGLTPGARQRVRIQARDVSLSLSEHRDSSILNRFAAQVGGSVACANPALRLVQLKAAQTPVLARITHRSYEQLGLQAGHKVWVQVKSVALLHTPLPTRAPSEDGQTPA